MAKEIPFHELSVDRATAIDRLMSYVSPEPNCGCWLFDGPRTGFGYGCLCVVSNAPKKAHRLSYELFKGPIPDGLEIRHTCDVRCCVNPDHLLVGTRKDNMGDMDSRGRRWVAYGTRHGLSKLTN